VLVGGVLPVPLLRALLSKEEDPIRVPAPPDTPAVRAAALSWWGLKVGVQERTVWGATAMPRAARSRVTRLADTVRLGDQRTASRITSAG
jgi:hypothetical protein